MMCDPMGELPTWIVTHWTQNSDQLCSTSSHKVLLMMAKLDLMDATLMATSDNQTYI